MGASAFQWARAPQTALQSWLCLGHRAFSGHGESSFKAVTGELLGGDGLGAGGSEKGKQQQATLPKMLFCEE